MSSVEVAESGPKFDGFRPKFWGRAPEIFVGH